MERISKFILLLTGCLGDLASILKCRWRPALSNAAKKHHTDGTDVIEVTWAAVMQIMAIAAPKKPGFFDWRSGMEKTQQPGRDQQWHQRHIQNKIGCSNLRRH